MVRRHLPIRSFARSIAQESCERRGVSLSEDPVTSTPTNGQAAREGRCRTLLYNVRTPSAVPDDAGSGLAAQLGRVIRADK